jgi:hypothetical protein
LAHRITLAMNSLPASEDCTGGMSAIDDLIAGELPKTIVMRAMAVYRTLKKAYNERNVPIPLSEVAAASKGALADHPLAELCDVPGIFLNLSRHEGETESELMTRVSAALLSDTVQEVRLISR